MTTCYYKFPCHPNEMFSNTPGNMTDEARLLRVQMIEMIVELSQKHSQKIINKKLYVDVDEENNIVGLDMSKILDINANFCLGKRVSVGKLTARDWTYMKIIS